MAATPKPIRTMLKKAVISESKLAKEMGEHTSKKTRKESYKNQNMMTPRKAKKK